MNTHIIVGVVSETPKLIEVDNKTPFIALKIQDITKYNRKEVNPVNTWDILKYGKKDNIEPLNELIEAMPKGRMVYISGTGLFNKNGYYNIIANEVVPIKEDTVTSSVGVIHGLYDDYLKEQNYE